MHLQFPEAIQQIDLQVSDLWRFSQDRALDAGNQEIERVSVGPAANFPPLHGRRHFLTQPLNGCRREGPQCLGLRERTFFLPLLANGDRFLGKSSDIRGDELDDEIKDRNQSSAEGGI